MENLAIAILLYIVIVAIANCPKRHAAASPETESQPVNYFPEPTTETNQPAIASTAKPEPVVINKSSPATVANPPKPLEKMTIRQLYAAAKTAKIPNYKRLNKSALVSQLAA